MPNEKYLKRYRSTFLAEIQAALSAWHPVDPRIPAPAYSPDTPLSFVLDDAKFELVVGQKKRKLTTITVTRDGKTAYRAESKPPGAEWPVITFYRTSLPASAIPNRGAEGYDRLDHWILEYWNQVVVDSVELNDRHNFQSTFFYRIVLKQPLYFAEVYDQVRVCWGTQIADQKYDEVFYAPHASPKLSPQHYENVVAFYARRDKEWYYVLAGVPGK